MLVFQFSTAHNEYPGIIPKFGRINFKSLANSKRCILKLNLKFLSVKLNKNYIYLINRPYVW